MVSEGKLSSLARNIALTGKNTAKNMMVLESVEGYASLIENIMKLPSEVASPRSISEIPSDTKTEWQWHLFEAIADHGYVNRTLKIHHFLDQVESQWNRTLKEQRSGAIPANDTFVYGLWEEEKRNQIMKARKAREDDEVMKKRVIFYPWFFFLSPLKLQNCYLGNFYVKLFTCLLIYLQRTDDIGLQLRDRSEQSKGTWEEVYKNSKKADRSKNDLHERDEGELERTGQPLCIYEPYFGQGSWPFLHQKSLYRGVGLVSHSVFITHL